VNVSHAQTSVDGSQLSVSPRYPDANQVVKVRLENYGVNLNTLEITWSLNGVIMEKGVGDKDFEFTIGSLGSASSVRVSSSQFTKTIQVRPSRINLIWQAHTYTPPFYKGKALYTHQSKVDIIAIPSFVSSTGALINPDTLVYKWTRNGTILGNQSGYGKRVLSTAGGTLAKPLTIEVEASTIDGVLKNVQVLELKAVQPHIILYENHPLYGVMYNQSVPNTFTLTSQEIYLSSTPYFFETNQKNGPTLSYEWKMNGQKIPNQIDPSSLILRRPEGNNGGVAIISLLVRNTEKILQYANRLIKIQFETLSTANDVNI